MTRNNGTLLRKSDWRFRFCTAILQDFCNFMCPANFGQQHPTWDKLMCRILEKQPKFGYCPANWNEKKNLPTPRLCQYGGASAPFLCDSLCPEICPEMASFCTELRSCFFRTVILVSFTTTSFWCGVTQARVIPGHPDQPNGQNKLGQ